MKVSDLSFADHAAVEVLPALVKHFSYLGDRPEVEAVRYAYKLADALSAERDRRNDLEQKIVDSLRERLQRAEASYAAVLDTTAGEERAAKLELWERLGVDNQPQAIGVLTDLVRRAYPR